MGVERVILEHHRDVASLGWEIGDIAIADADHPVGDALQTGHQSEDGGLAAPRRPDQDQELAVVYFETEVARSDVAIRVDLVDMFESDACHWFLLAIQVRYNYKTEPDPRSQ